MATVFRPHGSFVAMDCNQNRYVIEVLHEVIRRPNCESPPRALLKTSDNRLVQRIEKGSYEIIDSGRLLRSDDPACF
jgi:hypothetical protein